MEKEIIWSIMPSKEIHILRIRLTSPNPKKL
jgi:hypothetical protein